MDSAKMMQVERARGASLGAVIMGGFGSAWLALGVMSLGVASGTAWMVTLPVAGLFAVLGVTVRRRLPGRRGAETPEQKEAGKAFAMVNVAEWLAIFGVVNLLRNLHEQAWVLPAVVLIVGAHFVPLGRIFGSRSHLLTGLALMVCAGVSVLVPAAVRDAVVCLSAGSVLWLSAAYALRCSFRAMPGRTAMVRVQRAVL